MVQMTPKGSMSLTRSGRSEVGHTAMTCAPFDTVVCTHSSGLGTYKIEFVGLRLSLNTILMENNGMNESNK